MWCAGERRNVFIDFVGDPEGKTPHVCVDGRMILK